MPDVAAAEPPVALLRPGLELAWWVAKLGTQARPSIDPPGRLRPFLRAAKLPDRFLTTIRQVVDTDEEFRGRVAAAAEEGVLGRASWLWLVRPEGWADELAGLAAEADSEDSEKGQRARLRALERVESDLARARGEVAAVRQVNEALTAELRQQDQARRQAERDRDRIQTALQTAKAEREQLVAEVERLREAVESAARADAALGAALDGARQSDARRQAAEAEVARLESELAEAVQRAAAPAAAAADLDQVRAVVADAVARAGAAAAELGAALAAAGRALVGGADAEGGAADRGAADRSAADRSAADRGAADPGAADPGAGPADGASPAVRAARGLPGEPSRRRRALPLPPAVFDDSIEAAAHLVRTPGVLLVVDGYNVTLSSWPGLDLPEQRQRLVDALAELTTRAGTTAHVIFDGIAGGNRLHPPAVARHQLRVEFSPSEVEADEMIIALVADLDPTHPVVVATDDRRVRHEASQRGANVISVGQLLAVLGRSAAPR